MKKYVLFLSLVISSCSSLSSNILVGQKVFKDRSEWEQTNEQLACGVAITNAPKGGIGVDCGIIFSGDTSADPIYINRKVDDTKANVRELYIGIRKNFELFENFQLFVGGGVSSIYTEMAVDLAYSRTYTDRSLDYAPYAQVGMEYMFTENLYGGMVYRHTFIGENADIFITSPDINCNSVFLSIGWRF